jgi:O-antigen ligase
MIAWLAVLLTFALGPLQWITLVDVGLALKPVHPPFFLAAALGWAAFVRGQVPAKLVRAAGPFILLYGGYLFMLLMSVMWGGSLTFVLKYTIYFLSALGFMFLLSTYEYDRLMRLLFWAGLSASLFFIGFAAVSLAAKGINLISVIGRALSTGNPALLQFMIFRNLFDLQNGPITEDSLTVALRHTSLGFIYIGFLFAAATAKGNYLSWAAMFISSAIILLSVSRGVTLAVILALSPLLFGLLRKVPTTMYFTVLSLVAGIILLPALVDLSGVAQIVDDRFGSFGQDGRLGMYEIALGLINERPLMGFGVGHRYDYGGAIPFQVHNLFLGAWIQGGILCLVFALGFTAYLVALYFKRVSFFIADPSKLCLLGVLILPLFRSQISGSGGAYTLPEWICIAIVLALFAVAPERKRSESRTPYRATGTERGGYPVT